VNARGWFVFVFLGLAALHGCVGTPGRPVSVPLTLALEGREATTSLGWTVRLEAAALRCAAVLVRDAAAPSLARLEALLVPRARAHGGHGGFDETVLAAWAGPEVLVLGEERRDLWIEGRAGTTDRLAVILGGATSGATDPLGDGDLRVVGTAVRGETSVRFEGGIRLPEAEPERLVEGIPLTGELEDGAALRVAIDLAQVLDAVRFDRLAPGAAPAPIDEGSQAALALRLGALAPSAYVATWSVP
jgi:hypothetical protein